MTCIYLARISIIEPETDYGTYDYTSSTVKIPSKLLTTKNICNTHWNLKQYNYHNTERPYMALEAEVEAGVEEEAGVLIITF